MYNLVDIHFHTDDSFDAFRNETFDVDKLISVLKDEDENYSVRLLCKTDHNRFNFKHYLSMAQKFSAAGITLLPGIEINAADNIHWIFIFDNTSVCEGVPEYNDYHGQTLDDKINEYFGYDASDDEKNVLKQAEVAQSASHEIKDFIKILHKLNVPYIAIPHLNKTKGWYAQLKKDPLQLNIVEEYLNSNIINGFESKNQDDFITNAIQQTENCIAHLQNEYEQLERSQTETKKKQFQENLQRRIDHLAKMIELKNSISNGDVALIYGSDFHCRENENIESYRNYKEKLFFIKAKPTFEGLRISLLDQYSRIFSQERKKKYSKQSIACIDYIVLEQAGKKTCLSLGDGLNSIIGARGTGKSYLLSLLTGKTEKYNNSSITSDIKMDEICFSDGSKKSNLTISDYDILTQRGANVSTNQNENSIYGLLADAPFKMSSYLEEVKKLDATPVKNLSISSFINQINELIDCYIEINDARKNELNLSFIKLYNEYYNEQSENIHLSDIFSNAEQIAKTENTQLSDVLNNIETIRGNTESTIKIIKKIEKQKAFPEIGVSFEDEKRLLEGLINDKLKYVSDFYADRLENYKRILNVVNSILSTIRQNSTNIENTLTGNINDLSNFINKTLSNLRKSKQKSIAILERGKNSISDEEIYRINVGKQVYEIKTISSLDLFALSQQAFDELFSNYKVEYSAKIFIDCFQYEYFGKRFIEKIYKKFDRRYKDFHFKTPILDKELFLNFDNGEFKNWANLSPGQRADKLLDIVLNGDSGKILLIDQPEDDLDNETIYKTITRKIRDLKLRRQIILVTHNANIAITGDSDALIVCQNDNEHFSCYCDGIESQEKYSYKSINSTLDERKILLIAAEILDGGKEAIRKRVRKIGYKDIFYKEKSNENNF